MKKRDWSKGKKERIRKKKREGNKERKDWKEQERKKEKKNLERKKESRKKERKNKKKSWLSRHGISSGIVRGYKRNAYLLFRKTCRTQAIPLSISEYPLIN